MATKEGGREGVSEWGLCSWFALPCSVCCTVVTCETWECSVQFSRVEPAQSGPGQERDQTWPDWTAPAPPASSPAFTVSTSMSSTISGIPGEQWETTAIGLSLTYMRLLNWTILNVFSISLVRYLIFSMKRLQISLSFSELSLSFKSFSIEI